MTTGGQSESSSLEDTEVGTAQAEVYLLRGATPDYRDFLPPGQASTPSAALLEVRVADVVAFALPDVQGATALAAAGDDGNTGEAAVVDGEDDSSVASLAATGVQGTGILGDAASLPYVTAPTGTYTRFFEGYRDGGGLSVARVAAMIWCESSWRIDPPGIHLGLAQFEVGTWATVSGITGYADPYNPYHQGFNVAVWASMVSPGTSAGWPNCWWAW